MFGLGNITRRRGRGGNFGRTSFRNAAIAGVGMLAMRWWRNRQAPNHRPDSEGRGGASGYRNDWA